VNATAYPRDAISLRELYQLLVRERWIVILLALFGGAAAFFISWLLPIQFEATTIISPVSNNSAAGRLGGQASQLGGLAALVGISFGGDSNRAESLAVLQSEALTERFIRDNNLLPVLFPKEWDPARKDWRTQDPRLKPTLWKGNKTFVKIRNVVEDKKSSLVSLTITWTDPVTAANWANGLVTLTNDVLRAKAIRESEQHIAYLKSEAMTTDVAQVRAAIYAVLESEIKNVMLAKGPGDYALKVLDPAVPAELKTGPKKALWTLAGLFLGFLFSLCVLYVRSAWRAGA
jgi:uncharacterized protein involved in exopolysaccharide biosynthesis